MRLSVGQDGRLLLLPDLPTGTKYRIKVVSSATFSLAWIGPDGWPELDQYTLSWDGAPGPTPPNPPDPPNPPNPPNPPDPPEPPPTPSKLQVMVLYESAELAKLPPAQARILLAPKIREYLDVHCQGGRAGYRFWDKDSDVSKESPSWKVAFETSKTKPLPRIVIWNATTAADVPLPADETVTLELLKKYGGQ
jgi:hypothetical protein